MNVFSSNSFIRLHNCQFLPTKSVVRYAIPLYHSVHHNIFNYLLHSTNITYFINNYRFCLVFEDQIPSKPKSWSSSLYWKLTIHHEILIKTINSNPGEFLFFLSCFHVLFSLCYWKTELSFSENTLVCIIKMK